LTPTLCLRRLAALAALAAACAAPGATLAAAPSLEGAVKAAFLTKFGAFVTWPGGGGGGGEPLNLCVVGDDPFGTALDQAAQRQQGYPIAVRRMPVVERGADCDILYAAGSERQSAAQALQAVEGTPVLTVTDAARSGGARGIIHFVVFEDRVRFQVDTSRAGRGGISISSKLLSLALSVKR
jgi:hypothetical protein